MTIQPHWAYYSTVLKLASQHGPIHRTQMRELSAASNGISAEEFVIENDRGTNIFDSLIHWSVTDMVGIGALVRTSRGVDEISFNNPPCGRHEKAL